MGDMEGLSLRPHCRRVGGQVPGRSYQHMWALRGLAQQTKLAEGSFNHLDRVKVAVFPDECSPQRRQQPI